MKAARILLIALLAIVLAACGSSHSQTAPNPSLLRVALLPDENANTVIQNNQPLKHYLESKLGKQIELVVAYGDPASTSSHLIPKSMLADQGLRAGQNYQEQFVGAHDAVALAVQNGNAAGGGISKPIFGTLVQKGTIDPAKVRVVAESKPYPNYPWTMRSDLDTGLKSSITNAFLSLQDPAVLKPFKAVAFAPVTDADYNPVRQLSTQLGLDLSSLSR
jgi:ABC-type phosphate/phosphonate transport system substrate-binding protein